MLSTSITMGLYSLCSNGWLFNIHLASNFTFEDKSSNNNNTICLIRRAQQNMMRNIKNSFTVVIVSMQSYITYFDYNIMYIFFIDLFRKQLNAMQSCIEVQNLLKAANKIKQLNT